MSAIKIIGTIKGVICTTQNNNPLSPSIFILTLLILSEVNPYLVSVSVKEESLSFFVCFIDLSAYSAIKSSPFTLIIFIFPADISFANSDKVIFDTTDSCSTTIEYKPVIKNRINNTIEMVFRRPNLLGFLLFFLLSLLVFWDSFFIRFDYTLKIGKRKIKREMPPSA